MRITTRVKVLASSGLGLTAIVAMVFVAFAPGSTHAAPGSTNPYILSNT